MKLTAISLLEGKGAEPFEIPSLTPRIFVDLLDSNKALLFPSVFDVESFGSFLVDLKLKRYPYIGGAAPRTVIPTVAGKDIIFTSNESPPDQPIPFHHELAQCPDPPAYIFFYCDTPTESGGQTPIIDSTKVYRFANDTHPTFIEKLKLHGARYIRTLPAEDDPSSPIGRSYKSTWNVNSEDELDAKLSQIKGCEWEWQPDGCVRITTEPVPAIRLVTNHVQNNIFQWTFANSIVAAFLGWQDCRNDRHKSLLFGNNDQMPEEVLQSIADFMEQNRVLYTWKKGDVMALNNKLVMHSRNPFDGKRRVLASIWGGPQDSIRLAQPENGVAIGTRPDSFYDPLSPADPLVFGFWKVPKGQKCEQVCYQAIAAGYRRLDCACDYGNEKDVGRGISKAIADGIVTREELFITSKLWNTYHQHVSQACAKSMKDLGLSYLDEYLIHFPISLEFVEFEDKYPPEWTNTDGKMVLVPNDMGATWAAMEALVAQGLVKNIGVCNFSTQLLRQLLSTCRIRPSTLQIEMHPHNSQERLLRFAREAGMRVTAFSAFGASSYISLDMATADDLLMTDKTILAICDKKQKTPAQVLLRWAIQRNTLPLSKTCNPLRMKENRQVFDFYLTVPEMERIDSLNKNRRYNDPGEFCQDMGTFCPIYD
jgi:diketogulonate reductase-like aldo/keto reductase